MDFNSDYVLCIAGSIFFENVLCQCPFPFLSEHTGHECSQRLAELCEKKIPFIIASKKNKTVRNKFNQVGERSVHWEP